jgi:hypothetical protein
MNSAKPERATGTWFGVAITAVAMMISAAVVLELARTNKFYAQELRESRFRASIIPASGKLAGLNALDGSEWVIEDDKRHLVVLFGVAEEGAAGDMEYWRDVASRSQSIVPDIQFVGFCAGGGACGLPPAAATQFTLLKSMDPLQTHALINGARQHRAFVFRGSQSLGMVLVIADREAFALQIAELSRSTTREGGV